MAFCQRRKYVISGGTINAHILWRIYIYNDNNITQQAMFVFPAQSGQMADVLKHMFVLTLCHVQTAVYWPSPVAHVVHVSHLSIAEALYSVYYTWHCRTCTRFLFCCSYGKLTAIFTFQDSFTGTTAIYTIPSVPMNQTEWYVKWSTPTTWSLWHNHVNAIEATLNYLLKWSTSTTWILCNHSKT